jgi:hypothetical protein
MNNYARFALILMLTSPTVAAAADDPAAGVVTAPIAPASLGAPPAQLDYDLPWQLRPVTIGNAVRIESAAAGFNDAPNGNLNASYTTMLTASYQVTRQWAPMLRLGFVGNDGPGAALDGSSFVNPVVGATYARSVGNVDGKGSTRLALFGAATIPVGTGGGDAPNLAAAKTNAESMVARPADQAMFAVNYTTAIVGGDVAYVNHGFTAQGEVTLQQSVRVRGSNSASAADAFRTNSSVGLHVGYFVGSHFSVGADLLYQRWLSHPTALNTDTLTFAGGPRLHFKVGKQGGIHPGLSFVRGFDRRGFDAPLVTAQPTALQIDIPVMF